MMKLLLILINLFGCITLLNAQALKVSGVVKDGNSQKAIENATVQLLGKDSVFIEGCVTDQSGKFELGKGKQGNMFLVVTYVGYEQNIIFLDNILKTINIGNVLLDEKAKKLDEIVVSSERVVNKVNRQIIIPSGLQVKSSSSAFDLLSKMMLPDLLVNTTQNTISSLDQGSVQLRINNVKSTLQEVLAILSTQVIKVEYTNTPGARYGEGIASVVNFITRRAPGGISGGTSMKNAVATGYGNDNFYLKYNHKSSEFAVNYNLTYRDYKKRHIDVNQSLVMPDGVVRSMAKEGINSPVKAQQHDLSLTYNLTNKEVSVFNVKLSNCWQNTPYYNSIQLIRETGENDLTSYTGIKDKSFSPVLDIYYQLNLPSDQTLMANVVGTYISSDYLRDYAEYLANHIPAGNKYGYTVDGNKRSVISELIYEKTFHDNMLWSSGINYKQFHTENHYNGSTGDVIQEMQNSDLYLYSEIEGSYRQFGYNVGLGVSKQYFKEGSNSYNFFTFRPQVTLSYSVSKNLFLRYSFEINPILPSLVQLSDVYQWQNDYEVWIGNPSLRPFRGYANSLNIRYRFSRFMIQASGYYQYSPNPIWETATVQTFNGDDYVYQFSYDNQKSYTHLQGRVNVTAFIIKNALSLSVYGGVNRHINRGNESTYTNTGFYGGAQLEATYKKWGLSASINSKSDAIMGEKHYYKNGNADIAVSYKLKNLKLGLGIMNPFFSDGEMSREKFLFDKAPKDTRRYTSDLGNMVYVSCSWNFHIGRQFKAGKVQLINSDRESGVVK
ncbi:MAG: TonB-dependent receptor [Tannerellaceae bacterium]